MAGSIRITDAAILVETLALRSRLVFQSLDDLRVPVDAAMLSWLPPTVRPTTIVQTERVIAQVDRVTSAVCVRWRLTRTTCLPRALIRARLLRTRGVDARVHIGVNQTDGFRAHAWISVNAQPLMETGVLDYTEIMQLPRNPSGV
jgi:hypothetical protein